MSTHTAAATDPPSRAWLSALDGRHVAAAAVVISVLLVAIGPRSAPAFVGLVLMGMAIAAVAAYRWPLATLVAASLLTLTDGEIAPRLFPPGVDLGPIGLSEPLLFVAGTVIVIGAARRGAIPSALRDLAIGLVVAFVAVAVVSAVVNRVPPVVALLGIAITVDAIAIYAVARMIRIDDRAAGLVIAALVATVVSVAIVGIAQVVIAPTILGFSGMRGAFGEGVRISSVMGSPNMVAAVIGLAFPFALFGSRHLPDHRLRWLARIALVVLLLALLLTFSRGGWLAVGLGGLVGALVVDWRTVGVLAIAGAIAWAGSNVLPRDLAVASVDEASPAPAVTAPAVTGPTSVSPTPAPTSAASPGQTSSAAPSEPPSIFESTIRRILSLSDPNDTRGRYLRDGLRIIAANPVLGVGPGRYGGAAAAIIPSPIYEQYDATLFTYRTVHNFWLHLLGESGIVGTLLFVALVVLVLVRLLRAARHAAGIRLVLLGGAATMLMVVSLHSVTEMLFEGNMPAILIWLMLGIASTFVPLATSPAARPAAPA